MVVAWRRGLGWAHFIETVNEGPGTLIPAHRIKLLGPVVLVCEDFPERAWAECDGYEVLADEKE